VLYDLKNDIAEQRDLAADHPDIAKRISGYMQTARTELPEWVPRWRKP
jgi:hypothetical protein